MIVPSHFVPLAAPGMVKLGLKWMWNPASPFYIKPRFDAGLFSWGFKFMRAANAGHVQRAAPLLRDLSLESRKCFDEFTAPEGGMEFGLVKKGLLMLCKTSPALEEEAKMAEQAKALGVPADVLDAKQTATLDPGVRMDIAGSVYFPLDCHLTTHRFVAGLQAEVERMGVRFMWQTETLGALMDSDSRLRAVKTSSGNGLEADEFVLCGGSWSSELGRSLGVRLPMQAGKGYSLTLPKPRRLPQICSICTEARVAVTPMDGALRVGGTMEIAGLNEDINPVRVRGIIDSFCRYFPEFRPADFDGIQPWRGLRPCAPDGLPYIGRTRKFSNLCVATGHGMMGLSLGPVTGKMVAEILSGEKPRWDIAQLSPDRYD
jgi:D-amino-acid dehydrogenase